ncbi:hypothetical protein [Sulfitobacter mediterraneus]|uniref:Uncharacterized protein n=1 Tax=Sulfitobacter mediterraneus TaxID=83219 RepID=A0A061SI76_9RHOB|nr:hypothetical protein [Sulfitobacter mediterraneus]KAJ01416.1 hypothetical protein PM02_19570 [Sulfitobacter mediterraneus]
MQSKSPHQIDPELSDKLFSIVNDILPSDKQVKPRTGLLTFGDAPFHISQPNQHDTKAEFEHEYQIVTEAMAGLRKLVPLFLTREDADQQRTLDLLRLEFDAKMQQGAPETPIDVAIDLVRSVVADVGGLRASVRIFIDLFRALSERRDELEQHRDKFWNLPHRAPEYYARAIANRLAKLYARKTGQKPTSGASTDTGDASTKFTKALEQIFSLLDIQSGARSPADWAIKNLTEEDLAPRMSVLENLGLGPSPSRKGLSMSRCVLPEGAKD